MMNHSLLSWYKDWTVHILWACVTASGILIAVFMGDGGIPLHRVSPQASLVVLSPHFDDAVLSLGGFLVAYGDQSSVVTFFSHTGEKVQNTYWDSISGFANSAESKRARTRENARALGMLGVSVTNFSYTDFQYETDRDTQKLEQQLTQTIASFLKNTRGQVVVYGPGIFPDTLANPDHTVLHRAYVTVLKSYVHDPRFTFLFYEEYPYIKKYRKSSRAYDKKLEAKTGLVLVRETIPLTERDIRMKLRSLKEYVSQLRAFATLGESLLSGVERFNQRRCTGFFACEMVYRVAPPEPDAEVQ